VATSKLGLAFASIDRGLGVGGGMVHSVSGVERAKVRGVRLVGSTKVPVMFFPSELNLPSYVPNEKNIFKVDPSRATLLEL
jgi:hypothetical protein